MRGGEIIRGVYLTRGGDKRRGEILSDGVTRGIYYKGDMLQGGMLQGGML